MFYLIFIYLLFIDTSTISFYLPHFTPFAIMNYERRCIKCWLVKNECVRRYFNALYAPCEQVPGYRWIEISTGVWILFNMKWLTRKNFSFYVNRPNVGCHDITILRNLSEKLHLELSVEAIFVYNLKEI